MPRKKNVSAFIAPPLLTAIAIVGTSAMSQAQIPSDHNYPHVTASAGKETIVPPPAWAHGNQFVEGNGTPEWIDVYSNGEVRVSPPQNIPAGDMNLVVYFAATEAVSSQDSVEPLTASLPLTIESSAPNPEQVVQETSGETQTKENRGFAIMQLSIPVLGTILVFLVLLWNRRKHTTEHSKE